MPSAFEEQAAVPRIVAEDVWIRFRIQFHRQEMTLRETFVRLLDRVRRCDRRNGEYDSFWPLRGINLVVQPGEIVGVVGKNGSGKTTLLKTLAGILSPDRGRLEVRGRVGCLLSFNVGFNPALSGRENVFLNGSLLGLSQRLIRERFGHIVEMSELGEFINAPVRTYSSGMRARLGFSIAVHIDPDVLMLDEVLGVGDAAFRAKTGGILEQLRTDNKTIVIASHDMNLIRRECNRAVWLDQGQIRMEGDPNEVTLAYLQSTGAVSEPKGGLVHAH